MLENAYVHSNVILLFFQGKWIASVSMVVGNELEDDETINIMGGAVASGARKLFSIISKEELLEQVI